jgi:large-conductance mechanosensitive channel
MYKKYYICTYYNEMSEVANQGANVAAEGVNKFLKLMTDFNVIGFALGIMIGNNVAELANTFIDGIIMPTLEPALKRVGGKKMTIHIGGLTFHLEKFVQAIMKFIGISIVIFLLLQLGINMSKPVGWVSIRSVADGVNL